MSTPTPETDQSIPTIRMLLKLHLEHMDLDFAVSHGQVHMAATDFVELMSAAKPKHAGLFGDTLKKVVDVIEQADENSTPASTDVNRRMFDALASVQEIRDSLNKSLDAVTGELARLVAMPPMFDDTKDLKVTAPLQAAQPAPEASPASTPTTPAPTAATEPATPTNS